MTRMRLPALLASALCLAVVAPAGLAGSCGTSEQALRQIKLERWPDLYRKQDVRGLAAFLAPDFRMIDGAGKVTTRQDELRWLAANPWTPSDFAYSIQSVTCPTPDLAMIIGEGRSTRAHEGGRVRHSYMSSNMLVRTGRGWQAVLSHISGERKEPLN
jgi:ketosteroid isomerase-like protein